MFKIILNEDNSAISWQRIGVVLGVVVSIMALIGGVISVDTYYAHASDVEDLEQNIEQKVAKVEENLSYTNQRLGLKIVNDEIRQQLSLKWQLEDRLEVKPTKETKDHLRLTEHSLRELEDEKQRLVTQNTK